MSLLTDILERTVPIMADLAGNDCTVRRPHTVTRVDRGTVAGNVQVKTTTAAGLASVPIEIDDSGAKEAEGKIPAGTVVVINAVNYTLTSEAEFASDAATLAITPVLAAEATAGDAVTLPDQASFTTFAFAEVRKDVQDVQAAGWSASDRFVQIFHPATLPTGFSSFRQGREGDYLDDSSSVNLGRIDTILLPAAVSNVTTARLV